LRAGASPPLGPARPRRLNSTQLTPGVQRARLTGRLGLSSAAPKPEQGGRSSPNGGRLTRQPPPPVPPRSPPPLPRRFPRAGGGAYLAAAPSPAPSTAQWDACVVAPPRLRRQTLALSCRPRPRYAGQALHTASRSRLPSACAE
jgi:hypothetical protein